MGRTPFDIADIIRKHRPALEARQPLTRVQGRALSAITLCRTAALGGHINACPDCGHEENPSYNSCRNRNCPKCQGLAQERWIASRAKVLLPVRQFHGVFTVPDDLRSLVKKHPVELYEAHFQCAKETVLEMGKSRLGVTLGLTMILHTWNRKLEFHPHVHMIVSGGGLRLDKSSFKHASKSYLLPKLPMEMLFKGKYMDALRKLKKEGVIGLSDGEFGALMARISEKKWNVYMKPTFNCVDDVLKYLGRYTHRVGISNSRLVDVTEEKVTFKTKNGDVESIHPVTFLQRFVQHILPDGFKKIRHAGLYASPKALEKAKSFLKPAEPPKPPSTWQELLLELTGKDTLHCPQCGGLFYRQPLAPDPPLPRWPRSRRPRVPP